MGWDGEGRRAEGESSPVTVVCIFVLLLIGLWGTYLFHNDTQPFWHCLYSRGYLGLDAEGESHPRSQGAIQTGEKASSLRVHVLDLA